MIPIKSAVLTYRESIIKENGQEGFFNIFIFRRISIVFSWVLGSIGVNPNLITTISFIANLIAGLILLIDYEGFKVYSIILFTLGYILDMSDGEVARMTDKKSSFGGFYDPFLDRISDIVLPFCIGVGYYINTASKEFILLLCIILYLSSKTAILYTDNVSKEIKLENSIAKLRNVVNNKNNEGFISSMKSYVKWDGGFTIFIFAIGIFFNWVIYLFVFLALFYACIAIINFYLISKNLRTKSSII
jgi:phosphatidylglycerophosphate synthase